MNQMAIYSDYILVVSIIEISFDSYILGSKIHKNATRLF